MLRSVNEVVTAFENYVGLPIVLHAGVKKGRAAQVAKLKMLMQEDPELYTYRNLEAAIVYLTQQHQPLYSLDALRWFMPEVLARVRDVEDENPVAFAVRIEMEHPRAESDEWITRLHRAANSPATELLKEWKESRAGRFDG